MRTCQELYLMSYGASESLCWLAYTAKEAIPSIFIYNHLFTSTWQHYVNEQNPVHLDTD